MNSDTGRIYDITNAIKNSFLKKEEVENFVPFTLEEIVEIKGCKFKVRSIHPFPTNMITLEGIPKDK